MIPTSQKRDPSASLRQVVEHPRRCGALSPEVFRDAQDICGGPGVEH